MSQMIITLFWGGANHARRAHIRSRWNQLIAPSATQSSSSALEARTSQPCLGGSWCGMSVRHRHGAHPAQQYLVAFPGARVAFLLLLKSFHAPMTKLVCSTTPAGEGIMEFSALNATTAISPQRTHLNVSSVPTLLQWCFVKFW